MKTNIKLAILLVLAFASILTSVWGFSSGMTWNFATTPALHHSTCLVFGFIGILLMVISIYTVILDSQKKLFDIAIKLHKSTLENTIFMLEKSARDTNTKLISYKGNYAIAKNKINRLNKAINAIGNENIKYKKIISDHEKTNNRTTKGRTKNTPSKSK